MTKEEYGHVRDGFTVAELSELLLHNEIKPYKTSTFSGFFTELVEFIINFGYVKILTGKKNSDRKEGEIAPQNKDQLKSVRKVYRLYSLIYPFAFLVSQLDRLLFFTDGYVTIVAGRKADRA